MWEGISLELAVFSPNANLANQLCLIIMPVLLQCNVCRRCDVIGTTKIAEQAWPALAPQSLGRGPGVHATPKYLNVFSLRTVRTCCNMQKNRKTDGNVVDPEDLKILKIEDPFSGETQKKQQF